MRHPDDTCLSVTLTPDEADVADHMAELVGISSPSDLLRLGLWHLARHLDVPIGNSIFALTGTGKRSRRPATGACTQRESA